MHISLHAYAYVCDHIRVHVVMKCICMFKKMVKNMFFNKNRFLACICSCTNSIINYPVLMCSCTYVDVETPPVHSVWF